MTYIKRITMTGFKSFGNRTVSVKLAKGFTCIIGPNGNGKSNVIDALCFALGRMSKKTMRAKSLTDLIFAGSKTIRPAKKAEVEITFDNKGKEFPVNGDEYRVSRWIRAKGTSGYKIQGKGSTRTQVLNALAQANIDPDGSNQFILQGKIVELTHMNTVSRREFIETLIGLEKYDKMKEQTLKELEKADQDLGQFEAIFKEVSTQLKKVEKEKNDALRWKELDNSIKLYNAQLIALRIHKLREEEESINTEIEETQLIIEEMEGKIARQKEKIEAELLLFNNIEEDLSAQEEEKAKMDEEFSNLKAELSAKQATLTASKSNLENLKDRIEKLESQQTKLEEGQSYAQLCENTKKEIDDFVHLIDETNQLIDETVSEQKLKENEISDLNKAISKINEDIKELSTESKILEKNIAKNTKKLKKNESELVRLKVEKGEIQKAIDSTKKEEDGILKTIETLKNEIDQQKTRQKEIDKELKSLDKDRNKASEKLSELKAAISSAGAEIGLFEKQITDLETKKEALQKEYDRLTKGKKVEEQIKVLKDQEKELQKELKDKRDELKNINEQQKKSEGKKEGLMLKRRTLEAELNDIEKRLSGLKVELKQAQSDLKTAEREKTAKEGQLKEVSKTLDDLNKQKEKADKSIESLQSKIAVFQEERARIQSVIEKKEAEQEQTSGELESVLEKLQELTGNIDRSAGDVKSNIQNASQVAIDESANVFKTFLMDITDMLASVQEIAKLDEADEIKEQLEQAVTTLNFLIENADEPLAQMNETVRDASDEAIKESTEKFDGFIVEFTENFNSIRVALQATAVSSTSEQYKALDKLNEDIQRENAELSELNNKVTKFTTQIEQQSSEQKKLEADINQLNKRIDEAKEKTKKGESEQETKNKDIEKANKEIEKITADLENMKTADFFSQVEELQGIIDKKQAELSQVVDDLNALGTVKRILEDIEAASADQEKAKEQIKKKKQEIADLDTSINKAQEDVDAVIENINKVKAERDQADDKRTQLQEQIDSENEKLKDVAGRLKDLENVQKLIAENETLISENDESTAKIEDNTKNIETNSSSIAEKEKEIEKVQSERSSLEDKEKQQREQLKIHNQEKNKLEKRLDEEQRMEQRANEINNLKSESEELNDTIADNEQNIEDITKSIEEIEIKRTEKTNQISDLQQQRSDSQTKQNGLRDELTDLSSELSRNNAKFSNLDSRRIVIEEKIDDLMEASKEYGALPPVTDDLSEPSLNSSIAKASEEKKNLEPVNLKAIEEYDAVKERWDEIDMRRQTLQRERKAILDSLDRIELEKTRNFMKAFHEINRVFAEVFEKLSPGGSAKMNLENPAHPFEGGIGIEARPRGKKISSLQILSGGEKTLVALSFIFAIQNFYPAPFYIMDEIDAALDGPNVYRVSMVIKEYADHAQFLVISHREENITNAERIYGVAMNDGITDIFTVNLEEERNRDDYGAAIEGTDDDEEEPMISDNNDDSDDDSEDVLEED